MREAAWKRRTARVQDEVMTVEEVARYLRLGRRVVYRLAQEGVLPGRKIANRWRFHPRDIEAWVRTQPATSSSVVGMMD